MFVINQNFHSGLLELLKKVYWEDDSPAISKVKVESDFQQGLIVFNGFGDGHLNLVTKELGLLVAGLDLFQTLLHIGSLGNREQKSNVRASNICNCLSWKKSQGLMLVLLSCDFLTKTQPL